VFSGLGKLLILASENPRVGGSIPPLATTVCTVRVGVAPEISDPSAEVDAVLSAVPFFQRHADSIGVDDSD